MKKALSLIISISVAICLFGCERKSKRYETQFLNLFDTMTQIVAYANSQEEFDEIEGFFKTRLTHYHKLFNIYDDFDGINNIKTINDNAGIKPVEVEQEIIDLLMFSKEQYTLTNGYSNIAFGSVTALWHEYRQRGIENPDEATLPPIEQLKQASLHTDIEKIIIDDENNTVFLSDEKMRIDVGSIAKGFAVEQVCNEAFEKGYDNILLSVGGNVKAIGSKLGEKWNVGIQSPDNEQDNIHIANVEDMSLVTSGGYQRFYTVDGVDYHHIINPKTLIPSEYFKSVTILTKDAKMGDMLSTAIFNMPFDEGIAIINSLAETEALWVFQHGEEKYSNGFQDFLQ